MTALLTLERSTQLEVLCNSILKSNERINFVAIINQKGRVVEHKTRDEWVIGLTEQKREMLFMEYALQLSMNQEFNDEFGKVQYTYSTREKISSFSFLLSDYAVIVITKPNVNPVPLAQFVIELISASSGSKEIVAS